MSWATPLTSESDLIDLFRELGESQKQQLIKTAFAMASPDCFFGGPMHGEPIGEDLVSREPLEITADYDEARDALYTLSNLGVYVFESLVSTRWRLREKKGGAA